VVAVVSPRVARPRLCACARDKCQGPASVPAGRRVGGSAGRRGGGVIIFRLYFRLDGRLRLNARTPCTRGDSSGASPRPRGSIWRRAPAKVGKSGTGNWRAADEAPGRSRAPGLVVGGPGGGGGGRGGGRGAALDRVHAPAPEEF
jgi:hypothetical protein